MYYLHLGPVPGLAPLVAGIPAVLFRQTNIVFVGLFAGWRLIDAFHRGDLRSGPHAKIGGKQFEPASMQQPLRRGRLEELPFREGKTAHDDGQLPQRPQHQRESGWSRESARALRRAHRPPLHISELPSSFKTFIFGLFSSPAQAIFLIGPHLVVMAGFLAFVCINGGIVVGDRSAHVSGLHLPQFLYFMAVAGGALFPYTLRKLAKPCVCDSSHTCDCPSVFLWLRGSLLLWLRCGGGGEGSSFLFGCCIPIMTALSINFQCHVHPIPPPFGFSCA